MLSLSFIRKAIRESKPEVEVSLGSVDDWIFAQIEGAIPHLIAKDQFWLKSGYIPTDEEMPSTLQMLNSDFFNEFRAPAADGVDQDYQLPKKPL